MNTAQITAVEAFAPSDLAIPRREPPSLAHKAARGAIWTIATSMGGRAIGVLGTLAMTRFLYPHQIGEVSDAVIIAMTANWLSIWGFGQYTIIKARGADAAEVAWHATVAYMAVGAVFLGIAALFGGRLVSFFDAPNAAMYVAPMAFALWIRRLGAIPERVLSRDMKFRAVGMSQFGGEVAYTVAALSLAANGFGGWSIVLANIVQSLVCITILIRAAGWASWATPTRLRWARFRDMLRFGVPLGIQNFAHGASRYWDNLAISHFFGTGGVGAYNMAYNLADIPAVQVGEQLSLVLMPSMANLPPERRPAALERATALLSLIIFPLAIGLGLVATPLIALVLPANDWQLVAPLLAVLACLSVFRPVTWVLSAYLEAECKTGRLMFLELAKVALLLLGIAALQRYGIRAAAGAVGLTFGLTSIAGIALAAHAASAHGTRGPSVRRLLISFFQPLLACVVMALAALGIREALTASGITHPGAHLAAMIAAGAIAYVAAAFVFCRRTALDLLGLLRRARRRE